MKPLRLVALIAFASLLALSVRPASAQYANEFYKARLIKQGKTSVSWAGPGIVVLQVEIHPDGSFSVTKVLRTTNQGDVAAALEIAKSSTYAPARRGSTRITSFYDYTLKFGARAVLSSLPPPTGPYGHIEALFRAKKYSDAKAAAASFLAHAPSDSLGLEYLGLANYFLADYADSATAFNSVPSIASQFKAAASQAFAAVAVKLATTNPAQALTYAQKANALDPSPNTLFALGVGELAMKQYIQSIASLSSARTALFAMKGTSTTTKMAVDSRLLQAYLATGDRANTAAMLAEMKSLNPADNIGAKYVGVYYFQAGMADAKLGKSDDAIAAFDQAAAAGDPKVAKASNTEAAFTIAQEKHPDYKLVLSYAKKALAIDPQSAEALLAEGIGYAGESTAYHRADLRDRATGILNQALTLAKAKGNAGLILQIKALLKQIKQLGG